MKAIHRCTEAVIAIEFSVSNSDKSIGSTAGKAPSLEATPTYQSGTSRNSVPDYTLCVVSACGKRQCCLSKSVSGVGVWSQQ